MLRYPCKIRFSKDVCFISNKERSLDGKRGLTIETAYFRLPFEADENLDLDITITAISRYVLYVNGVSVTHGPVQGSESQYFCDQLNLKKYLKPGKNVLAVKVASFPDTTSNLDGILGPYHIPGTSTGPCLLVEAVLKDSDGNCIQDLSTGIADWYVSNDEAVIWHNEELRRFYRVGAFETVDGSKIPYGWNSLADDVEGFEKAIVRWNKRSISYAVGRVTPYDLHVSEVPMQVEKERLFDSYFYKQIEGYSLIEFPEESTNTILKGQQKYVVDLIADTFTRGYVHVRVKGGKGSKITITYGDAYSKVITPENRGNISANAFDLRGNRLDYENYDLMGPSEIYIAGGQDEVFEPFMERAFRIVRLCIETKEEMELYVPSFIEASYPLELCVEETLEGWRKELWDMSLNSLRLDMRGSVMNVPFYEEVCYGLNASLGMQYLSAISSDKRLVRKTIDDFASSLLPDGSMQARYPSTKKQVLNNFPVAWLRLLLSYYEETGDRNFVYKYRTTVMIINDWFKERLDEHDLIFDPYAYGFYDWTDKWDIGRPHCEDYEPSTIPSLLYVMVLDMSAYLMSELGYKDQADEYEKLATRIRLAVNTYCYDQEKGVYRDGITFDKYYSQLTQVLAIVTKTCHEDKIQCLLKESISCESLERASFPTMFTLLRALQENGMYHLSDPLWSLYKDVLGVNAVTVPEQKEVSRGESDSWSSMMLYEYTRCVLGIYAYEPGYEVIGIHPVAYQLKKAKGSFVTPKGKVEVEWHILGDAMFEISVKQENEQPLVITTADGKCHRTSERNFIYRCPISIEL